ncbi:MAG: T9SS type A sorting domain-containing protein [Bacteroidota bacterium]
MNIVLQAQDLTVCASGCDHSTVAAAIASALNGDIIEIQDAVHTEDNIIINKNITIQGQGRSSTILQAASSVALSDDGIFDIGPGYMVTLQNMTLQNGNAISTGTSSEENGGAIRLEMSGTSLITLNNLLITNCEADNDGGAILQFGNSGTLNITECIISGNSVARIGGACILASSGSNVTLTRCSFLNNSAGVHSGAILTAGSSSDIDFINCTIAGNSGGTLSTGSSVLSGGMSIVGTPSCIFWSCTITNNSVTGNRLASGVYYQNMSGSIGIVNTIIADNLNGPDVYIDSGSGSVNTSTSLVRSCSGSCPSWTYTSDPDLAAAATCGNGQTFYVPNASPGLNTGITPPFGDLPTTDICNVTREFPHDIGARDAAVALPVSLIDFNGKAVIGGNLLQWQTATELNNKGFDLERSTNGLTWEKLSFIHGQGNSFQTKSYSYMHEVPIQGSNYYRLKQVDTDGTFEYSKIISVLYLSAENNGKLFLYPNPATTQLTITNGHGIITIYNLLGQALEKINVSTDQTQVDLSNFSKGQYILQVKRIDGKLETARFIK